MTTPTFKTDDGYKFFFIDGSWVDNTDSELVDMTFEGDENGPVDGWGEPLGGELSDTDAERHAEMWRHAPLKKQIARQMILSDKSMSDYDRHCLGEWADSN